MDTFIIRLKNHVENQAKKNGFVLRYLTADILLDFIRNKTDENNAIYDLSYGTEIKDSYLNSVYFNVSLPELDEAEN
jgi:hypothetical protein